MAMPRAWGALALVAAGTYGLCAAMGWAWDRRLNPAGPGGDALFSQLAGEEADVQSRTYQRLRRDGDPLAAEYGFQNFNRDMLSVSFRVPKGDFSAYDGAYGYSQRDLDALRAGGDPALYEQRVKDYMASRGFRVLPGHVVEVDMPLLVKRNSAWMSPLAKVFDQIAISRQYDSETMIGAVASLVQTAIRYQVPPPLVDGVHNGGLWPPVKTVLLGWGDCDTKTGLLASILANWPNMRMVGIAAPEHYLMGVLRIPNKGDLYVEYQGLQYVLVEPAGPAWLPPGQVGVDTVPLLESGQGYRIDPFF